jgi:quercetin dioxygenase-like cupin family protein
VRGSADCGIGQTIVNRVHRLYHWAMQTLSRRKALSLLPLFAASASVTTFAEDSSSFLTQSHAFSLQSLKATRQKSGWETRQVLNGKIADGEALDIHHSVLPAGQAPHPPHQHKHAELMVLQDGKIDFYNNGVTEHMVSGDIVFAAPNQLHGWKNVGDQPARYYVIAIGTDA